MEQQKSQSRASDKLLDELKSIQSLLNNNGVSELAPPEQQYLFDGEPPLLDVAQIFPAETLQEPPANESQTSPEAAAVSESELEFLIQEVVDELLPQVEATLRGHIKTMGEAAVVALAQRLQIDATASNR